MFCRAELCHFAHAAFHIVRKTWTTRANRRAKYARILFLPRAFFDQSRFQVSRFAQSLSRGRAFARRQLSEFSKSKRWEAQIRT